MRQKLGSSIEKIGQAEEALKRLRELAEISGSAIVDLQSHMGRFDSAPGVLELTESTDRVRSIMKGLGSSEETIAAAIEPWARTLCFDVAIELVKPLVQAVNKSAQDVANQQEALQPNDGTNPEWVRLGEISYAANTFVSERLRKLHTLKLDAYPDGLLALFDEAPLVDAATRKRLREEVIPFVPGMKSLRDTRTLIDEKLWIATIEGARRG